MDHEKCDDTIMELENGHAKIIRARGGSWCHEERLFPALKGLEPA